MSKICPECGRELNIKFWMHVRNHGYTDTEAILLYENVSEFPKCANPECNNRVQYDMHKFKFNLCCSLNCRTKVELKKRWSNDSYRSMMCKSLSGRKFSEQGKLNVSKGVNKFYESEAGLEFRKRLSESHKRENLSDETRSLMSNAHKGKPKTLEARKKQSISMKNFLRTRSNLLKQQLWTSPIELNFIAWLIELGYNVESGVVYKSVNVVTQFDALITFNNTKIVFECDGQKFHEIDKDINRDKIIHNELNYKFLRLDSGLCHEILDSKDNIRLFNMFENVELNEPYFNVLPKDKIMEWKLGKLYLSSK